MTRLLVMQGLAGDGELPVFTPLTGGVSCDVFRVDLVSGPICVKQALPQLRVAGDWQADPGRAHAEANWLRQAPEIGVPAPRLLLEVPHAHLIVMEYLSAGSHSVWKGRLMSGEPDPAFAAQAGAVLAQMHVRSWRSEPLAAEFANAGSFESLRIDPFLREVSRVHTDLAAPIGALIAQQREPLALVHGDFSPKNILCGPAGPVILDAECANFGDPAFDLAFCLAHLLLKTRHIGMRLLADAEALVAAYAHGMGREAGPILDRAVPLLAALMLARVDGKSPAGYLRPSERTAVRASAREWLLAPPASLRALFHDWRTR